MSSILKKLYKMRITIKNQDFWRVSILALILDQVTKYLVVINFKEVGDSLPLWQGVFHLTYVQNTGAAFSVFQGGAGWLRWLSLLVSVGLMILGWREKLSKIEQFAYGFILAGAFGNGIDRFLFGYVVDFLDFRLINFPIFNIADVCINIGIILLIYVTIKMNSQYSNPK